MATMKEIAEKCGVSTATVSKALNGSIDIGPGTAKKIHEAAKDLGYFPNSIARALKTKRTYNLGVLFVDEAEFGLGHEYFSAIFESVKANAERRGYDITFLSKNIGGNKMGYLEHCRYRNCDGVVIVSVDYNDPEVLALVNSEIPVVTIDHVFNNRTAILSDNVCDMKTLTEYIISKGHTKIAFVHGGDVLVTKNRLAGFHLACLSADISVPDSYVKERRYHDPDGCAEATRELLSLESPPTCIIYPDDYAALGGISEIERHGLKIPEDISIAAYDGIYLSRTLSPRLTTIKQNTAELGGMAAAKLVDAIESPKTAFPERICVSGTLLAGGTVVDLNSKPRANQ